MKVITITENNMKEIYGRLNKFFHNNNATGFEEWHSVNCGFKRHISRGMYIDGRKIKNVSSRFPAPDIRIDQEGPSIIMDFTVLDPHSLKYGDKIAFCGNHIILRTKEPFFGENLNLYTVYQASPMTQETQQKMRQRAEADLKQMYDAASEGKY